MQQEAWPAIASSESTLLLLAPTGFGKTLAAFLSAIDRLFFTSRTGHTDAKKKQSPGVRVLYISPLKSLAVGVDRNLRVPIAGLRAYAEKHDIDHHVPQVAVRSGDTTPSERNAIVRTPRGRKKGTFYFTWVLDLLISVDATNIESITRWVCLPCPKSGQWPQ